MVRTRMKDKAGTSVINVQISANNEIEYLELDDVQESDLEESSDGEEELLEDDLDNNDPELITNTDGTMSIQLAKKKTKNSTIVEHVCGKCCKTYSTFAALKRHLNLCRNLPKNEVVSDANDFSHIDVTDPEYETFCFCCNEDKTTAHVSCIFKMLLNKNETYFFFASNK